MSDLFGSNSQLEQIQMPDADVSYMREADVGEPLETALNSLIDKTPWRAETVFVWGKSHQQPRLVAWYGDEFASYKYSGVLLNPLPWTSQLLRIKGIAEKAAKTSFNSVLLNYYRDHRDSMGPHSDDEPELGKKPIIASLSLGEERTLFFKHKFRSELKPIRLTLLSGSLLLMKGSTQQFWKHGINKQSRPCGPRINLTFRNILTSDHSRK